MNQQTDRNVTMHGVPFHRGSNTEGAQARPPQMRALDCMCDRFAVRRYEPSNAYERDVGISHLYAVAGL